MPGAVYLLLLLILITLAVLTVKFYLQLKNGTPSRSDAPPPEPKREPNDGASSRVYFVRQDSARKTAAPELRQVSPKNLFVLEQVDAEKAQRHE